MGVYSIKWPLPSMRYMMENWPDSYDNVSFAHQLWLALQLACGARWQLVHQPAWCGTHYPPQLLPTIVLQHMLATDLLLPSPHPRAFCSTRRTSRPTPSCCRCWRLACRLDTSSAAS